VISPAFASETVLCLPTGYGLAAAAGTVALFAVAGILFAVAGAGPAFTGSAAVGGLWILNVLALRVGHCRSPFFVSNLSA
jgi:hypothetical protein